MSQPKIQRLEQELSQARSPNHRIDVMNRLGWACRRVDPPRLLELSEAALLASERLTPPYLTGKADSLVNMAFANRLRNFPLALEQVRQAIDIYGQHDSPEGMVKATAILSGILWLTGHYTEALQQSLVELAGAIQQNDRSMQAEMFMLAGMCLSEQGDNAAALDYYSHALGIAQNEGNTVQEALITMNRAQVFQHIGQYEDAIQDIEFGLPIWRELGNRDTEAIATGLLAGVSRDMGNFEQALRINQEKLVQIEPLESDFIKCHTLLDIGKVYVEWEKPHEALPSLEEALQLARKNHFQHTIIDTASVLVTVYRSIEAYQKALETYDLLLTSKETLTQQELTKSRESLTLKFEVERSRMEADHQRQMRNNEREQFERLSRLRDDYIAHATHDLKNPLSSISVYANLLRHYIGDDPKQLGYIDHIENNVLRMRQLVNDMLELARLESSKLLMFSDISLEALVAEVIRDQLGIATHRNIDLQFEPPSEKLMVSVDTGLIRRAMTNLLGNAITYTHENTPVQVKLDSHDRFAQIHFIDNGPGIEHDALEQVFDPFYRAQTTASAYPDGSGLGLAIVKTIVEHHKGSVSVESTIGEGATFTISLPLAH